ncbi:2-oxo-4-hydroxy-4-carboxy-5-ureidoimidazoline decarboxylase [Allostreptomyces psammosilenae]|uniref:2-oxo-4-hydroxy-4-carboxy-5-ureidoimidazoline decarboxylase n=1 Tax=Allostreptomyces psammosilenae TaxID=1892865 RepID=A0A853A157_9ACTN|nr:2-oxo-4-hydroxy-4-carboxy-5-ureidoimidazoline decarboxylase [Allostreptomyces psammosilenae]NYI08353.1 2-oxo-4-hydroxy-4-carboxy-5-ureidoimidazoline decarboxylase [Allostreptomyces psammosilenae]
MTDPSPPTAPAQVARLDRLAEPELRALLAEVCAARSWADALLAARPFGTAAALLAASDAATAALDDHGLAEAMAAHARIGAPREGDARSAREQSGVRGADPGVLEALREAGRAYEERFGHIFLICASGLPAATMLDRLRERLGNDAATERRVALEELAKINRLRLERLLTEPAAVVRQPAAGRPDETPTEPPTVSTHVLDTALGRPAEGVPVELAAARDDACAGEVAWTVLGASATDADGRCRDLPVPPPGTTAVRLRFATASHHHRTADRTFFPEVSVAFAVEPGQHYHVPLLLNPYGYSVYRGS